MGVAGMNIGTRFITKEAPIHPNVKKALVKASELDTVLVMRALRNRRRSPCCARCTVRPAPPAATARPSDTQNPAPPSRRKPLPEWSRRRGSGRHAAIRSPHRLPRATTLPHPPHPIPTFVTMAMACDEVIVARPRAKVRVKCTVTVTQTELRRSSRPAPSE
jgi:hypothetical protein